MFPGTFVISMVGIRELAAALGVDVDWLVENLPHNFIIASDAEVNDNFGFSVDVSSDGTRAIIGAYVTDTGGSSAGAAYIYKKDGDVWSEEAILYASDRAANDLFGCSVSINSDGSKVLIGARSEDTSPASDQGAAYVFSRTGTSWSEDQKLLASDKQTSDQFGFSVDISEDGNYAIIGAYREDENGLDNGAAYIFKYSGSTWTEEQKLIAGEFFNGGSGADPGGDNSQFGYSVSIDTSGRIVIIGARLYDVTGTNAEGAAFVFKNSPSVITVENQAIAPSETETSQFFGNSIDVSGDKSYLAVGARSEDNGSTSDVGAVYILRDSNGTWVHDQKVRASDAGASDQFGQSVAMSNSNRIIIGADREDENGLDNGAAYIFRDSSGTWVEEQKLIAGEFFNGGSGADAPSTSAYFGNSVDISDNNEYAIVGARSYDGNGGSLSSSGAAFVFKYDPTTIIVENQAIAPSETETGQLFGNSIAISGNKSKAVVGARSEDNGSTADVGAVYFLRDSNGVWIHDQKVRASDAEASDQFGQSVAMSKDGNYAIIGAYQEDENGLNNGAAYIFRDSSGTWVEEQKLISGEFFNGGSGADAPSTSAYFGNSVDISKDGNYVIVGAQTYDGNGGNLSSSGAAFVFKKDPTTITIENQAIAPSETETSQFFGNSIDVSGDGSKAVVGARSEDLSGFTADVGAVYFLRDSNGTWVHDQKVRASDAAASDQFGQSVAMSKDGNYAIVGADREDENGLDNGAAYVFKDSNGTWVEKQKLLASDVPDTSTYFGISVDISKDGNYAIVGAQNYDGNGGSLSSSGAAYVFKDSNGTWVEKQRLEASDKGAGDLFGGSVSISNDGLTALIGAFGWDTTSTNAEGAAYIFTRSGETWTQTQRLEASDAEVNDNFGYSVDIDSSGEYAIIGAYQEDDKGSNAGAAYIFKDSSGTFVEKQKLTASDGLANDNFGYRVSISDSSATAVIGAYSKDYMTYLPSGNTKYTTVSNSGAAYVFKQTNDVWSEFSKIQASDAEVNDNFGISVSISGDASKVLVGAQSEDTGADNNGRAYSFNVNSQNTEPYPIIWRQEQRLEASDKGTGDLFGGSVAIDSDGFTALIGAFGWDTTSTNAEGAAYVFRRTGSNWSQDERLEASDQQANDNFGYSVDLSKDGTCAIIGAYQEDDKGSNAGAAYIFKDDGGWSQDQKLTASDGLANDNFGYRVSISGDGNFVVIGAYSKDYMTYLPSGNLKYTTVSNTGAAYVFKDSGGTWGEIKKIQASDAEVNDNFGISVSIDDTGSKVLVGAQGKDTGAANNGRAYSFNISTDSEQTEPYPIIWRQEQRLEASDKGASDLFGGSVSISNDGSKALIGAYGWDTTSTNGEGAAYVFSRSNTTWTQTQRLEASDQQANDNFGYSVDITQDGNYGIIGAYQEDDKGSQAGAAYIFKDSNGTWVEKQKLTASDGLANDNFGYHVSADSNATYFIVGANSKDYMTYLPSGNSKYTTLSNTGAAYIFKDSAGTWGEFRKIQASDAEVNDNFGISVSISNDGLKAAVGAQGKDTGAANNGRAYSFNVDDFTTEDYPIIWRQEQRLEASDRGTGDIFGNSVAIDGSGSKALIGAYGWDTSPVGAEGAAYVFKDFNGTWTQTQRLEASDQQANDQFGYSVDLSTNGEYAIIGALGEDDGGTSAGAAYIFRDSNDTFVEKRKLAYFQANSNFGQAVALDSDGSVAVIGANAHDYGSVANTGSAVIYDFDQPYARDPRTLILSSQTIINSSAVNEDRNGYSIDISNDKSRVVLGASQTGGSSNNGYATVFRDSNGTYVEEATLTASDPETSGTFGYSISIDSDADTVIIGAQEDSGAAYIFNRTGTSWSQTQKLTVDLDPDNNFGRSVAMSADGEYVVIGSLLETVNSNNNAGVAYVFRDSGGTWVEKQRLTASDAAANDNFGNSVAISADHNYLIVGSILENAGAGATYVFKDSNGTWVEKQKLTASDAAANDNFGRSVAISGVGDYVIIGADAEDAAGSNTGSAYVFKRTNETWSQDAKITYPAADTSAFFGRAVDISKDGDYAIIGAYLSDAGVTNSGAAFVYSRSGSTWTQLYTLTDGAAADDRYGHAVSISGDATVVGVGAERAEGGGTRRGSGYIFTSWKGS